MKVLFVASECAPFVKTGGLGDVVGSLPLELARQGVDARVILPNYKDIPAEWKAQMQYEKHFYINLGWRRQYCGILSLKLNGVTFYFVDNEFYFARDCVYGYGNEEGERFAFFCRAVLEALAHMDFRPDVLHLNDWQSGMISALLKIQYAHIDLYKGIKTVFTIHNLRYQGIFPWMWIDDMLGVGKDYFTPDCLEYYGCISFLKGGIVFSDMVTTVSPAYAQEILTPFYGERMDGLLSTHKNKLMGILNGIDLDEYNPNKDKWLAANYSKQRLAGKAICRLNLQEEMNLEKRETPPIIAIITRLVEQKGLDLIECVLDDIMRMDAQFVLLGSGEGRYAELFSWAAWRYQGRLSAYIGLSDALAHKIFAGADIFLMPSLFEPCGLSQLVAMRYGTIPIVRETGGLRNTVKPYNKFEDSGTGFSFANYNAHEMLSTIERAVELYYDKPAWERMIKRAMAKDFSWRTSARSYIKLYEKLTGIKSAKPQSAKATQSSAKAKPAAAKGKGVAKRPAAKTKN